MRQRLTQAGLALRTGQSRRAISLLERGRARELSLATVEVILASLGARIDVRVLWNGPELDRMLDAGHAALGVAVKRRLERRSWIVRVEVSFSRYGERGRIDLLAWYPSTGFLLVIELKTDLVDVQSLLGSLDVKARLARQVAAQFGWEATAVVPAIVFTEDRRIRNRLVLVDTLFDRFPVRGRAASSWLRQPMNSPSGLLWFAAVPHEARRAASHRVYARRGSGPSTPSIAQ